jgi:hypothetical protein
MVSGWDGLRQRRILVGCYATGLHGLTRATSPRPLPTNHDYDGKAPALIHEYLYGVPQNSKRLSVRGFHFRPRGLLVKLGSALIHPLW